MSEKLIRFIDNNGENRLGTLYTKDGPLDPLNHESSIIIYDELPSGTTLSLGPSETSEILTTNTQTTILSIEEHVDGYIKIYLEIEDEAKALFLPIP